MVVPWQAGAVFVGFTGLPHPDYLQSTATWLIALGQNSLNGTHLHSNGTSNGTHLRLTPEEQEQMRHAGEQVDDFFTNLLAELVRIMLYIMIAIALWIVFTIFCMCMYKHKVHDHKPKIKPGNQTMKDGNFHHGILGCLSNMNECLCASCCTAIRFADTHSSVTETGFWMSFWLFIFANSLAQSAVGDIVEAALPPTAANVESNSQIIILLGFICRGLMWGVWSRGKLRTKLGDPNPSQGRVYDFASWMLCPCCALTQESVEADIAANVTISCPCSLKEGRPTVYGREVAPSDYQRMVGDAVLLDAR